jgi:hypothetical protein
MATLGSDDLRQRVVGLPRLVAVVLGEVLGGGRETLSLAVLPGPENAVLGY